MRTERVVILEADLNQLVELGLALRGRFHSISLIHADEPARRATEWPAEAILVVCLDGRQAASAEPMCGRKRLILVLSEGPPPWAELQCTLPASRAAGELLSAMEEMGRGHTTGAGRPRACQHRTRTGCSRPARPGLRPSSE